MKLLAFPLFHRHAWGELVAADGARPVSIPAGHPVKLAKMQQCAVCGRTRGIGA